MPSSAPLTRHRIPSGSHPRAVRRSTGRAPACLRPPPPEPPAVAQTPGKSAPIARSLRRVPAGAGAPVAPANRQARAACSRDVRAVHSPSFALQYASPAVFVPGGCEGSAGGSAGPSFPFPENGREIASHASRPSPGAEYAARAASGRDAIGDAMPSGDAIGDAIDPAEMPSGDACDVISRPFSGRQEMNRRRRLQPSPRVISTPAGRRADLTRFSLRLRACPFVGHSFPFVTEFPASRSNSVSNSVGVPSHGPRHCISARIALATGLASITDSMASAWLPVYACMNAPASKMAPPQATAHFAKSAIRGSRASSTSGNRRNPSTSASRRAPRMRGRASSNRAHSSASGLRAASGIALSVRKRRDPPYRRVQRPHQCRSGSAAVQR